MASSLASGLRPARRYSVGVVIPTQGRVRLAVAVKSALDQTYPPDQVVVAVDGPLELVSGISLPHDDRLLIMSVQPRSGEGEARNAGIKHLGTDLVALLDDDDEWAPQKLQRQIQAFHEARASGTRHPVIACRASIQDSNGAIMTIQPTHLIQSGQRVGDYLFRRRRIRPGGAMLQSSMLLFDAELTRSTPFYVRVRRHGDWDWLLRAAARNDTAIIHLGEQLIRYTAHPGMASAEVGWEPSLAWVLASARFLSPGEQADCLLCHVAPIALVHGDLRGLRTIVGQARQMRAASIRAWLFIAVLGGLTAMRASRRLLAHGVRHVIGTSKDREAP
jgi:hypothetical protein